MQKASSGFAFGIEIVLLTYAVFGRGTLLAPRPFAERKTARIESA
jgi:hypothetical protein